MSIRYSGSFFVADNGAEISPFAGYSEPDVLLRGVADASVACRNLMQRSRNRDASVLRACMTYTTTGGEQYLCYGSNAVQVTARQVAALSGQTVVSKKIDMRDGDAYMRDALDFRFVSLQELQQMVQNPPRAANVFLSRGTNRLDVSELPEARQRSLCRVAACLMMGKRVAVKLSGEGDYASRCDAFLWELFELLPAQDRCEISFVTACEFGQPRRYDAVRLLVVKDDENIEAVGDRTWIDLAEAGPALAADEQALQDACDALFDWCTIPIASRRFIESRNAFSGRLETDFRSLLNNASIDSTWWHEKADPQLREKNKRKFATLDAILKECQTNFGILVHTPEQRSTFWRTMGEITVGNGGLCHAILDDLTIALRRIPTKEQADERIEYLKQMGMGEEQVAQMREEAYMILEKIDGMHEDTMGDVRRFSKETLEQVAKLCTETQNSVNSQHAEFEKNMEKHVRGIIEEVREQGEQNADRIRSIETSFSQVRTEQRETADALSRRIEDLESALSRLNQAENDISDLRKALGSEQEEVKKLTRELDKRQRHATAAPEKEGSRGKNVTKKNRWIVLSAAAVLVVILALAVALFVKDGKLLKEVFAPNPTESPTPMQTESIVEATLPPATPPTATSAPTTAPTSTPAPSPVPTPEPDPTAQPMKEEQEKICEELEQLLPVLSAPELGGKEWEYDSADKDTVVAVCMYMGEGRRDESIKLHVWQNADNWTPEEATTALTLIAPRYAVGSVTDRKLLFMVSLPEGSTDAAMMKKAVSLLAQLAKARSKSAEYTEYNCDEYVSAFDLAKLVWPYTPDDAESDKVAERLPVLKWEELTKQFFRTGPGETVLVIDDPDGVQATAIMTMAESDTLKAYRTTDKKKVLILFDMSEDSREKFVEASKSAGKELILMTLAAAPITGE